MERVESRTPPQSLEAEQSVLGSILLDNEVYANLEGSLRPEHFYKEAHRKIYRAVERLFGRGEPMDLVTLTEELRQMGELESVGSVPYLIGLADGVPTAAYADSYAKIVVEKATLRELISASGQIMQTAFDQSLPMEQILDKAERSIFDLSSAKRAHAFAGMGPLVTETFAHIHELFENPDPVSGLRMGFKELDVMTAGLQHSSLNVLAARPSMGKTSFALTIAMNAALREKRTVGVFSLEMSGLQLVLRMLCSEARVDMSRVRNGQLSDRDFQRLADTAGKMSEAKIYIDDRADLTVMELRSRARRLMAEHDLGLIIVDYLQLMSGGGRFGSENRQQEISSISRGLKALARELDVPVLVLSQLSRAVESRPNKRPMLSDLRECVPGETPVVLADGRRLPIRELVDSTPCVTAVDACGRLVHARAERVWRVGARPLKRVVTASGRCIRATARHRLLAGSGWTRVGDLAPGDRLALARRLPEPVAPERWPDEQVALLGQLIGDGSYLHGQPIRYTSASRENLEVVRRGAEALGSTVRDIAGRGSWSQLVIGGNGHRWKARGVGAWLRDLGIHGQRSGAKRVPKQAFRLSSDQVALLLSHLWATDGCVAARKDGQRGSHAVYYATHSRGLADDVVSLLLRLGIVARVVAAGKAKSGPSFRVYVSGSADQRRFLAEVGAFGPRIPGATRLAHALGRTEANAPSRTTMRDSARLLADPALEAMAEDDLYWDEIVAVEDAGKEEVFDLTVPGPASWLADGIVSHNSGAIEQDADLVMFIYRDEYYDPHSEKQGIAEIIVGKQRNGPVGAVDLQFHNAHVRFNDLARATP